MKDKIQKLIAEIIGDGFTVDIKPVAVKPVAGGNVSSDFGAGVTTYLSVYTDGEGDQAIYVNGKLESHDTTIYGPDVVKVADGRLVRMRSAFLDESLDDWPENESELKEMIDGYQAGIDAGAAIGAPDRDGLVLRSEWNAKEGCFESSRVEPEKSQVPQVGEYVILPCGSLGRVLAHWTHRKTIYCMVEGANTVFAPGCLKPWIPKEGDKVRVSLRMGVYRDRVDIVERFDTPTQIVFLVGRPHGVELKLLSPYIEPKAPADHIADANKMVPGDLLVDTTVKLNDGSRTVPSLSGWILDVDPNAYIGMLTTQVASTMPNGWMVLHTDAKTEPRVIGDRFFRVTKGHWEELTQDNIDQANAQSWAAIRKIPSVVLESQELLGSKVEYREPTNDDISKKVEVRDHEKHSWIELQLVAILPPGGPQFCVEDKSANRAIWKYARIKAC